MKPLARDTAPEAQAVLVELLRKVPAGKKIELTFDLIQSTRLLVLSGLRRRYPNAGEDELRRRLISKLLPRPVVLKAYGFDPSDLR